MTGRVYLHIGLEKTGTTAIQQTLRRNAPRLLRQGILADQNFVVRHPSAAGNAVGLVAAALGEPQGSRFLARQNPPGKLLRQFEDYPLDAVLGQAGLQAVVFSSEHLSSWVTGLEALGRLRDFLDRIGRRITVIVYLRRQDRLAQSLVNELVKSGGSISARAPARAVEAGGRKLQFLEVLEAYRTVFGAENVVIRPFHRAALAKGDVVADFLGLIGADAAGLRRPPGQSNAALSLEALCVLSLLNDLQGVYGGDPQTARALAAARRAVIRAGRGRLVLLSRARAQAIVQRYAEDNRRISGMAGCAQFFDAGFDEFPEELPQISAGAFRALAALPEVAPVLAACLGLPAPAPPSSEA